MGMRKVQQARIRTAILLAGRSYTRDLRIGWVCLIAADEKSGSSSSEEAESCCSRASSSGSSSSSEDNESTDSESDPPSLTSWDRTECTSSRSEKRLIGDKGSGSPSCLCKSGSGEIVCGRVLRWRAQISRQTIYEELVIILLANKVKRASNSGGSFHNSTNALIWCLSTSWRHWK